jgi:hypothetical protein
MRLTKIYFGGYYNHLAIPLAIHVEEDEGITDYIFQFLIFYIGFTYEEVEA